MGEIDELSDDECLLGLLAIWVAKHGYDQAAEMANEYCDLNVVRPGERWTRADVRAALAKGGEG